MPYPSEHAARIHDPGRYVRFRRQNNKFGAGVHVIWGITKDGKTEIQAIRFDREKFTPAQARAWLKRHKYNPIEFAPAKRGAKKEWQEGGETMDELLRWAMIRMNEGTAPAYWRAGLLTTEMLGDLKGSYEWIRDQLSSKVRAQTGNGEYAYVLATFPGRVIWSVETKNGVEYYQADWSLQDGEITLGSPEKVELDTVVKKVEQDAQRAISHKLAEVGRRNNKTDEDRIKRILKLARELLGEFLEPAALFVPEDVLPELKVNDKNPKQWALEPADMKALIAAIDAELNRRKKKKQQKKETLGEAVASLLECPSRKGKTFTQWKASFSKWLKKAKTKALTGYRRRLVMHLAKAGAAIPKKKG